MAILGFTNSVMQTRDSRLLNQVVSMAGKFFRVRTVVAFAVLVLLLFGSFRAGQIRSKNADVQMRRQLLNQVTELTRTFNSGLLQKLTFTSADAGSPAFERIREQMILASDAIPKLRSIYAMAMQGDKIVFGPDNLAKDDEDHASPGTVYQTPPAELHHSFRDGRKMTVGPYSDEYGTFVSAFVPIFEPHSDKILMVVGVDIEANDWQAKLNAVGWRPVLVTYALVLILASGGGIIYLRNRRMKLDTLELKSWILAPTACAMLIGLVVYGMFVYKNHNNESKRTMLGITEQVRSEWIRNINSEVQLLKVKIDHIAANPDILQAWQNRDLASLTALVRPDYQQFRGDYKITHCYFITPDRICFLRSHQPDRRGDLIDRSTLLTAAKTDEDCWGLEIGPLGTFALRYVRPWKQDGITIGYLELGMETEQLIDKLATDTGVDLLVLIDKEHTTQGAFEAGKKAFGFVGQWDAHPDFVVAHQTGSDLPENAAQWFERHHNRIQTSQVFSVSESQRRVACGIIHLSDAVGYDAADLIVMQDITVETTAASSDLVLDMGLTIVLFGGLLSLLWSVTGAAERQLGTAFAKVQESEDHYRTLFDKGMDGICLADAETGLILDCNQTMADLVGRERTELIGQPQTILHPPVKDQTACSPTFKQHAADPEGKILKTQVITSAGIIREVEINAAHLTLQGRKALMGVFRDITERKRAEEALAINKAKLDLSLQSSRMGVWEFNLIENKLIFDPQSYSVLGINPATFWGAIEEFLAAVHPEDRETVQAAVTKAIEQSVLYEAEYRVVWSDRSVHYIAARGKVRQDEKGRPHMINGIVWDVTERKQAENSLRESETRMRAITDSAQDAILMMDPEGRISYWNRAAERIFGYTNAEAMGQNLHTFIVPSRYHEAHHAAFPAFQRTGQGAAVGKMLDLEARRKDGMEISVQLSLSAIQINGGWHAVGVLRDVTERKQAEAELLKINRHLELATAKANDMATQAEAANIAKSEFLANMSHEIRTPMNGVIGMTGLLMDTELTNEQRDYIKTVQSCGESLMVIINDILDFSKIEAGKLEIETLNFDIRDVLEDFAGIMAMKADEKGLEFICAASPDVPSYLRGDSGRLRQIMTNLTGNAIKFTATGEVALCVTVESKDDCEAVLRFSVRDTGIGIPADKIGTLFNKFTQVDTSTTRKYGGTGLGLAISKQLAEMMGGQIGVSSVKDQGSEFWFTVRLGLQPKGAYEKKTVTQIQGRRILVVDDNVTNRQILIARLSSWGAIVSESPDGSSALRAMTAAVEAHTSFEVVITDMQMPQMDGLMLGRAIRQDERLKETCLIMMTSLGQQSSSTELAEIGFMACLIKPVRPSELFARLTAALGQTGAVTPLNPETPKESDPFYDKSTARILLAEDNITNQQVALGMLKKLGLRADAVANGLEAIKVLEMIDYDLVLMDVQMPEMGGLEATQKIRSLQTTVRNPTIPIIAMTAYAMQGDRQRCIEAGMNDYVSKPVNTKTLAEKLAQWLPTQGSNPVSRSTESTPLSEPAAVNEQRPIYDREGFLDRLMGDTDIANSILEVFLDDIPKQIELIKQSLEVSDAEMVERLVHGIKGAAANIGGEVLRQLAADIEKACKDGRFDFVISHCPELEGHFDQLKEEIQKNSTT